MFLPFSKRSIDEESTSPAKHTRPLAMFTFPHLSQKTTHQLLYTT